MNTLTILLEASTTQMIFGNPMVMVLLIFAIFWFFMIRPQQKKQKEQQNAIQNFRNTLTPGAQLVTQGGIFGTVKGVDEAENIVKVEVASGVVIRVERNAVFPVGQAPEGQK